jgi:NACHT domain
LSRRISRRYVGLILLLLMAGAAIAVLVISKRYHGAVADTIISTIAGVPTLYLAWMAFSRSDGPDPTSSELADQLAAAVRRQWEDEVSLRRIFEPYALPVSWKTADQKLVDDWESLTRLASSWPVNPLSAILPGPGGPASLAGSDGEITDVLTNRIPTRRLVLLGEPGAGKTVLLVRLVLDLLAARERGGPVPVLAPLASWNPQEQDLHMWLEGRLTTDYPEFREPVSSASGDTSRLRALLDQKLLFLILDGLDELPPALRGPALVGINTALRPGEGAVLSSRVKEYREALDPGDRRQVRLYGAAGIELTDLNAADIRTYLRHDSGASTASRWNPVLASLGGTTPVAQVLRTPLMVGLARTIYNPQPGETVGSLPDPGELCDQRRFRTCADIERHLFDAFIPAAYRDIPHTSRSRWTAEKAEQWLIYLAAHLTHNLGGTTDLAWWELRRAAPGYLSGVVAGIISGLAIGIAALLGPRLGIGIGVGLIVGLTIGIAVRLKFGLLGGTVGGFAGGSVGGLLGGLIGGLMGGNAPTIGLVGGMALGIGVGPVAGLIGGFVGCVAGGIAVGLSAGHGAGVPAGLIDGLGAALAAALCATLVGRETPARGLRGLRWAPAGLSIGIVTVLGVGFTVGFTAGPPAGLVAGLIVGFVAAIALGLEGASSSEGTAADPATALARDRTTFLAAGFAAALAFGLGGGLGVWPGVGIAAAIAVGLGVGFIQATYGHFVVARFWLALRGDLPWRLMRFLADAHQKHGVLRQVGAVYQFRHVELQRRLSARAHTIGMREPS